MKKKELNQFKNQPLENVLKEIDRLRKKLEDARVDMASGKESNLKEARNIRKDIAQMLTLKTIIEREEKSKKKTKSKKS